ncbi:MAG: hypothetical protein CBB72_012015, partial [Muricauda sp. TMED12]
MIKAFIEKLNRNDVYLELIGTDKLKAYSNEKETLNLFVDEIKERKQELISFLNDKRINEYSGSIPLAPKMKDYPLSSSQRRLWIHSQFKGVNTIYNTPGVQLFEGDLSFEALERSFGSVIARHEILRTVFREGPDGD